MAKKRTPQQGQAGPTQDTSMVDTRVFMKGMVKDSNASFQAKEAWSHARNAANNSVDGDLGVIGNEPANLECAKVPYTIIGAIHMYADQWVLFSTDNVNSEIGLFDDSKCEYTTLVNAPCLSFNKKHLISGAAKENFDCSWQVYWDDGNNPSRTLNINDIPYIQIETSNPGDSCVIYEDTELLDCEKLRLAPLLDTPCITLSKSESGGQLRNGSYQAFIAYTVNEQKVTDYIGVSNIQTLFDHAGTAGSLRIKVTNLDKEFEYYELVILSNNQENTVAKRIGLYSTEQMDIEIDYIDQSLISIPLNLIPLRSPAYEKSEAMYVVNDWLIRQGPTEQFDFNYQPLANQIKSKWVVAEYPASYYYKGGNKTGFMRDEQYAFFIRWIYNTGERSSSYHIPGRAPRINGINQFGQIVDETAVSIGANSLANDEMNFQIFNTATITETGLSEPTDDGGIIIAKGDMAYWESSEKYPATKPNIWGNLCGKYIRHHKMPTEEIGNQLEIASTDGTTIRVLGVEFYDIKPPVDNNGNLINNIVGYEILRGSREGHKSILAKGIFKNMREYTIPDGGQTLGNNKGLYPNYPFNDLRADIYFHDGTANANHRTDGCDTWNESIASFKPLTGYKKDYFTFHSPELMFRRPFLNAYETRIYGELDGTAVGHFIKSENHPKNKLLRNGGALVAGLIGVGYAVSRVKGDQRYSLVGPSNQITGFIPDTQAGSAPGPIFTIPGTGYAQTVVASGAAAVGTAALSAVSNIIVAALLDDLTSLGSLYSGGAFANQLNLQARAATNSLASVLPGMSSGQYIERFDVNHPTGALPKVISLFLGAVIARTNIATGAQEIIDLFYNLVSEEDFAFKHNAHGFYNKYTKRTASQKFRTKNLNSNYIGSSFQEFEGYKINNLFRPMTVAIATQDQLDEPNVIDKSRYAIGGDASTSYYDNYLRNPEQEQKRTISALYGSLKFAFENQYGQLDGIKQIQMRGCIELIDPISPSQKFKSSPVFAGDTYVNRYTEKTIMPIFADFLNGQPDQYTYDYLQRVNIPYPRFWMDTRKYDTTELANEIISLGLASSQNALPNDLFYLDRGANSCAGGLNALFATSDPNPAFAMRYAYMYTHVNGVQDFFVESEYNLAYRDWEDEDQKRHYDVYEYNNVDDLFHADIIKTGNFYKYDLSLSVSKFVTQVTSFGNIQPRDYDPTIAETCYQEYPKRLIYSLQAQEEAKKDFWRVFLPNNYKDFKNKVTVIKPINKSGAIIFFPYQSPQMFQGVDQLQTDLGTKLTIGDGGLFSQPFQNIVNSDLSNEYGSSESARAVMNTPFGIFFISQAQGKVFQYTGQLENIANAGMKWWFNKYLPSTLVRQFPELEFSKLSDNPVVGVGCQVIYDVNDDIVYFMKKDFKVKDIYRDRVTFFNDVFTLRGIGNSSIIIKLGDPTYFEDTSWTVSYDPKSKAWISFHDWHPELSLPSINHFLTTKTEITDTPSCPPGYNFNPTTGQCEKSEQATDLATVSVDEVLATVTGGAEDCLIDIVIAMDVSGSTATGNRIQAQRQFVQDFLNSTPIANGMAAGAIQVGFTRWEGNHISSMNPGGFSMSNTVTPAQVATYYAAAPGGLTNICSGFTGAEVVLSNTAGSQLGNRSSDPSFRSIMLFMTDAVANTVGPNPATCGVGGGPVGCALQNLPNGEVYSIFCDPSSPTLPGGALPLLNAITCNVPANQFTVVANGAFPNNTATFIANAVAGAVCGTPPECDCPPGYTLVYKDSNGNYTEDAGECSSDDPPICRKVECGCPEPPFVGATTTQSGQCDDIYQVGDPSYINPDPRLCSYFYFLSTSPSYEKGGLWRHNYRCDLYSNYYGTDYPWEVELIENTGQTVTTLRSIEYQLESYVYKGDLYHGCADDRWHDLDFNFDESIIYNSEQISGLLRLELSPKEDPYGILQYPIIGASDIRILYSKEEQKYRFNQFWDITDDRGEFTGVERSMFITQLNGYIRDLNAANLNYNKESLQHKKFRHYYNKILLRRRLSGDRKMLLKLANTKLNLSVR